MGTFAKVVIFSFSLIGIFALLFGAIPGDFFSAYFASSLGTEKGIAERFSSANITMYGNAGGDNMTYKYSSYHDHPSAPQFSAGLPSGQYIEVWWDHYIVNRCLELRHIDEVWWGLNKLDWLSFTGLDSGVSYDRRLHRWDIIAEYSADRNGSAFFGECGHTSQTILLSYNQTAYPSIEDAWDAGEISYILSYEVNWNATGVSAWNIVAQLLTFQNPDLGITGTGGIILNYLVAIPLWLGIGLALLFMALAIIPLISGVPD